MSSEDVIELGSSEDEAEPVTKKVKRMPNAMVHIPTKLHGVTIMPAKSKASHIPKELAGKNVTVTKIPKSSVMSNAFVGKTINGKQPTKVKPLQPIRKTQIPIQIKPIINPLSLMKKLNSQVVINKIPSPPIVIKNPLTNQTPKLINNLPASISVIRTSSNVKRAALTKLSNPVAKKAKLNPLSNKIGDVLTVELDDDDVSSSSTASPQWYLRPEDQHTSSLEELNNKEPNSQFVEITIEDSPIKPPQNKRTCEVGDELAITIDDSPVKVIAEKKIASGSEADENSDFKAKTPHSKKKLVYPKEMVSSLRQTIEIEISPVGVIESNVESVETCKETYLDEKLKTKTDNVTKEKKIFVKEICESKQDDKKITEEKERVNDEKDNIIEIEESPLKIEGRGTSTPKKNKSKLLLHSAIPMIELKEDSELSEFHPIYRTFINLCFQLENSDDMKKIVEKKIKSYYRQVPKEYTESEEFTDMVSGKILAMKAGPEKMYLYIKDIVDELNLQRKLAKSQILNDIQNKNTVSELDNNFLYGEESEYDSKRQRQIRKLEKTIKKLHRAIQKLEEQEVDFDDDEDSVYLLTESDDGSTSNKDDKQLEKDPKTLIQRYKERMVRVHAKFCQLTNTKMPSEPRVQLDARPGHPSEPAKKLEKWINKKVPIGTPRPFPDFHDVLRCVREANEESKLGWNEADIMEEARDLFTRCGKKLQRRRQENEWRLAASRIASEFDPAEKSEDLKKKLEENKKIASKRETEVLNKYADRQSQLKLEAEEIEDKEGEQSPPESEDEDSQEEASLENKDKRKERLKRLIEEKTNKTENEGDKKNPSNDLEVFDISMDNETGNSQVTKEYVATELGEKESQDLVTENDLEPNHNDKKSQDTETDENIRKLKGQPPLDQNSTKEQVLLQINEDKEVESFKSDLNKENNSHDATKVLSVSDDSNRLDSDMDELHLLQKLHSGNELNTSTLESSDTESPIAISDTLPSSSDNKKQSSDVISIENSSYSESEGNTLPQSNVYRNEDILSDKQLDESDNEMDTSSSDHKKVVQSNNDEYNESVEDILLASSDDENEVSSQFKNESVNLKDDSLSIGDTVVEGDDKTLGSIECDKQEHAATIEEDSVNKQCDAISLKSNASSIATEVPLDTVSLDSNGKVVDGESQVSDTTDSLKDDKETTSDVENLNTSKTIPNNLTETKEISVNFESSPEAMVTDCNNETVGT